VAGHDDYGALRDGVLAEAHFSVHQRAREGLSAAEIEARLGDLTATERELLRPIIRSEVASARRARRADSLVETHWWMPRSARGQRRALP
jgi:hypothetical protein